MEGWKRGSPTVAAYEHRQDTHIERTADEPRDEGLHEVKIGAIQQVNESVRLIRLDTGSGSVEFLPGQWLDVFIPGLAKPGGFTITSPPSSASRTSSSSLSSPASYSYLELAIKVSPSSPPAAWLWRPVDEILGLTLRVRVGGSFVWPPRGFALDAIQRAVFIAGGVGINPLMSMLSYLSEMVGDAKRRNFQIRLLYVTKMPSSGSIHDILFLDRIVALLGRPGGLYGSFRLYLTGGENTATSSAAIQGMGVQAQFRRPSLQDLKALVGEDDEANITAYICGPPAMADQFENHLTAGGPPLVDLNRVFTERWW